jgi:hypothetical protein
MSDNVTKLVPNLDKLTSRIVLYDHNPEILRANMESIYADYGLGVLLETIRRAEETYLQDISYAVERLQDFQGDIRVAWDIRSRGGRHYTKLRIALLPRARGTRRPRKEVKP